MLRQGLLISALILILSAEILAQGVYNNKAYSEAIGSAQVYPEGNKMGYPFMELGSTNGLEFHFDMMDATWESYNYGVIHCTHDWRKSDIASQEYIQGFQFQQIRDIAASFNTLEEYVHYRFNFPNDMMKPRYSGNYLMVVFNGTDIYDERTWILTYRFLVYENEVGIRGRALPSAVVSQRFRKQDVNFIISHPNTMLRDPMRDLNVTVVQNMHWKSAVNRLKPVFMKTGELVYEYSGGENSFFGGNEYRNFEMKSMRYASNEVDEITREEDGYHVYLRADQPQAGRAQSSGIDVNGNWLIRNDLAGNSDLESEYVWVHWRLTMPEMPEQEIWIEGRFNQFDTEPLKCTYNNALKAYTAKKLIKQGYYNYRYVSRDHYEMSETLQYTEGNQSTTENDYCIIAYLYDMNVSCDRIIGIQLVNSVK